MDSLVIGGGITGLAAAFELSRRGVSFSLVEASPRLGGLIRTEHLDGFTIEAGPDSMLAQKRAALEFCEDLGLTPHLISTQPPRTAFVLKGGRLHRLPSPSMLGIPLTWRSLLDYDLLPWPARARLALERFMPARQTTDESVGDFFARRFGPATVGLIAEPLLGGIHAGRIESLSIASLFPRFVDAERANGSVVRGFARAQAQAAPSAGGMFRSLASGMSELVSAVERRLPPRAVRLETPALSIVREQNAWRVVTPAGDLRARSVIVAAPAHAAARLLREIDPEASALCAEVGYVSTASVALAFPRDAVAHPLAGSGFVVARRHSTARITACTWVSSKWPGRAPDGMVLLRAFVGGASDPEAVDLSDEAMRDVVLGDLRPVLGIRGEPLFARVYRWRDAGAQHNVGQLARMSAIEGRLARHPGLFVAGSGFRSIGIPDCVADGRAAAALAAAFVQGDDPAPAREPGFFLRANPDPSE